MSGREKENPSRSVDAYLRFDYNRALIAAILLTLVSAYLALDNFTGQEQNHSIGSLALFCTGAMLLASALLFYMKRRERSRGLEAAACLLISIVFWITHARFLYTGGTVGTSIFLIFSSAPVAFFFFNLVYGGIFCAVEAIGMGIYLGTPLHEGGYVFPDAYYDRLAMMYLIEIIFCALAQYETVKARNLQAKALLAARRANEAKTDFLANTSHEIRTPMNSILGYCELILRQENLPSKVQEYTLGIRDSGQNLLYIINDILDISKIEANRLQILCEDFETASLMNDVITITRARIGEKPLLFKPRAGEDLPAVLYGDVGRIRQIIINLVSNAVKYTREGEVSFALSIERGEKPVLTARVEDTGIGIKKEDLSQIFESFTQVDTRRNRSIEGTGLGLAISRRLAELMDGEISAESEYGVGSVFTMRIPVGIVDDRPMCCPALNGGETGASLTSGPAPSFRVSFRSPQAELLIVDDNPVNLHVACGLLSDYGMHIRTEQSGKAALAACMEKKFDLIFMDHMMPEMDGVETVRRLRESGESPNRESPVVALTANAISGMREMFLENGFQDYLSKPVELRELDRVLQVYLPPEKILEGGAEKAPAPAEKVPAAAQDALGGEAAAHFLHSPLIDERTASLYGIDREKLVIFDRCYQANRQELLNALESGDCRQGRILAHSLKSASLYIGAVSLSKMARSTEEAAAQQDEALFKKEVQALLTSYEEVDSLIGEVLAEQDQTKPEDAEEERQISPSELVPLLDEISENLAVYDAEDALKGVGKLKNLRIGEISLREPAHELTGLIDLFSFEEAGLLLEKIQRMTLHGEEQGR